MDPLFPELPENLAELTDKALADLLREHEVAAELIEAEDPEFTKGLNAEELITALTAGVEQIERIVAEQQKRVDEQEAYLVKKDELAARRKAVTELSEESKESEGEGEESEKSEGESESEGEGTEEVSELAAESEEGDDKDGDEGSGGEVSEEAEITPSIVASGTKSVAKATLRRPPAPSAERQPAESGTVLVAAAGQVGLRGGQALDRLGLANAMAKVAQSVGPPSKHAAGIEQRFLVAAANYAFPPERQLLPGEGDLNAKKIQAVIPAGIPGLAGNMTLVASGGLCAPLEPIYSLVNFASMARPVRDALPSFQASRGGVNVPASTAIGDITTAISIIEEAEDALGGTFATKSCQALECPDFTEVAVTTIAHCREYGNLNARAWPEKIAHENDLTMAAHARSAEGYLLDRIKALSVQTTAAKVINAYADLVRALLLTRSSVINVLRMEDESVFRILGPLWLLDLLAADVASTQFDRFQVRAQMDAHIRSLGFATTWYKDAVTGGTSQMFAAEVGGTAIDPFPDDAQIAVFPEGEFIHLDAGTLDLGIVRDSTLNSTNDFQIFGENFENVARLGPAEAARWLTVGVCPTGEFPDPATAYACA